MDKTTVTAALRLAPKFSALGHEARLAIVRLLLSAHPGGLVVGEIRRELDVPPSTLSHHLDALEREGLVRVAREGRFLRCRADAEGLRELLTFLYAECCTRSGAVPRSALKTRRKETRPHAKDR